MNTLRRLFGASSLSETTAGEVGRDPGVGRGLAPRMALACVVLALLVGAAFAVLLLAISDLQLQDAR